MSHYSFNRGWKKLNIKLNLLVVYKPTLSYINIYVLFWIESKILQICRK